MQRVIVILRSRHTWLRVVSPAKKFLASGKLRGTWLAMETCAETNRWTFRGRVIEGQCAVSNNNDCRYFFGALWSNEVITHPARFSCRPVGRRHPLIGSSSIISRPITETRKQGQDAFVGVRPLYYYNQISSTKRSLAAYHPKGPLPLFKPSLFPYLLAYYNGLTRNVCGEGGKKKGLAIA
jgi:hypothetical protein